MTILVCIVGTASAVDDFYYKDHVYVDNIRSVKFHVQGLYTSYPIVELNSPGVLSLTFDDLDGGSKYYMYRIIHCTADWQPSDLEYYEYIDGYEEEEIRNLAYSVKTITDYTNYWLSLPNRNTRWTKSGNYMLVVYEDNADQTVVITRRFMVVDTRVAVIADLVRPADVAKQNTHHEIDFEVLTENLRINNPKLEIKATVMQNGRWDNAYQGVISRYERGDMLSFDYQDKITFPAGKDFRYVDLRSVRYRSRYVLDIREYEDAISVVLEMQKPRVHSNYFEDIDLNGQYIIQNSDNFERNQRRSYQEVEFADSTYLLEIISSVSDEDQTESEYLEVTFSIEMPEHFPAVYLFGAFTDWELNDRYRLDYDARVDGYVGTAFLKQGYYDYYFVTKDKQGSPDIWSIEGSWYESDNNYTILIYYAPFGARYDQLIAAYTMDRGF